MTKNNPAPKQRSFEQRIILDAPINKVFHLFTPTGIQKWDSEWKPTFLSPTNGAVKEDGVFTTSKDRTRTIWMVKLYTTYKHHVAYHRVITNTAAGLVDIKCNPYGEQTRATITIEFTSLSQKGTKYLQEWSEEYFNNFISGWRKKINHFLNTGEQLQEE